LVTVSPAGAAAAGLSGTGRSGGGYGAGRNRGRRAAMGGGAKFRHTVTRAPIG
jgi:hypothetical protein